MGRGNLWSLFLLAGLTGVSSCKKSSPAFSEGSEAFGIRTFEERQSHWQELKVQARERAWLYEELIAQHHLDRGMVVDRSLVDGRSTSVCDSLLFSSLRFIALQKLGWKDRADEAWQGILAANLGHRWVRHPDCRAKTTSRDMIVGLLAALSLQPPQHELYLLQLARIIEITDGSVDPGPFYVSRLSPGIAEILRQLSLKAGITSGSLPAEVRHGFSTLEWDSWWGTPGYTSHLNALVFWIEYELWQQNFAFRTFGGPWQHRPLDASSRAFHQQRFAQLGKELSALDPENIYFQWLGSYAQGELSLSRKIELMEQLLAMPEFPKHRLPQNCDRKADYLWQRSSLEYRAIWSRCTEEFAGVDFLWMVAFLTEK